MFEETRRRLIEQAVVTGVPLNATTQAALCEAQKLAGTFSDPYRGPYLLGAPTATALLANCSDLVVPPVVVVVPASPPLPPVDVPELPPVVAPSPSPSPSPAPVPVKPQSVPEEPEVRRVWDRLADALPACPLLAAGSAPSPPDMSP